jgi:hypothetical protein
MVKRTFWTVLICAMSWSHSLLADPGPNQVFREFSFTRTISPYIGPNQYKTEFTAQLDIHDLEHAVRAEVALQFWGGHIGTSNQAFSVNNGDKKNFPQPKTPDNPLCYYRTLFGRPAVEIPLTDLNTGSNTFTFYCGPQVCYGFNWPHYWLYAFTVRVYYEPAVAHISGTVSAPRSGEVLEENPVFQVHVDSTHLPVDCVDLLAFYTDFDWEGDGGYNDWHYTLQAGQWKSLIGTCRQAPYVFTWNTEWVPDQSEPVRVMARIKAKNGICYTTPAVDQLSLRRSQRSVKMYACANMPQNFSARANKRKALYVSLPEEAVHASRASLVLSTWSAKSDDNSVHEIGINNVRLADNFGAFHDFSFNRIDVPPTLLRPGDNEIYIYSAYSGHALEINWPGPVILVEYLKSEPAEVLLQATEAPFVFRANFPNPFNQSTTISFVTPSAAFASLRILNQNGQLVKTLLHSTLAPGHHRVSWDGAAEGGTPVADGVYFAQLAIDDKVRYKKILLAR